jgi:hypothetical protein
MPVRAGAATQLSRITVTEMLYHWSPTDEPEFVQRGWNRMIQSDEQSYRRRVLVKEEWQAIDCGWLRGQDLCLLFISNEPDDQAGNPTPEEKQVSDAKVVELAFGNEAHVSPSWLIYPGESFRGCPSTTENLLLRCQRGIARVNLFLVPK